MSQSGVLRSMTGFGRGRVTVGGRRLVVEVRSVNHRFLELKQKLPWQEPLVEAQVQQLVRKRLERGAVSLSVREEGSSDGHSAIQPDLALGRAYHHALVQLRDACGLTEPVSLALVASQPGVLSTGGAQLDPEKLWAELEPAVDAALTELVRVREREGAALKAELLARVHTVRDISVEVAALAKDAPDDLKRRLTERLSRLTVELDPARLAQEVALLADRADVAEELSRLATHLEEAERLLQSGASVGRRLDFLAQELHREVNTIGSKSQRAEIAQRVVSAKVEVERFREQVQNVE